MELKFGIKVPDYPLDVIYDLAKHADDSCLDSIWMVDHLVAISLKQWDAYFPWGLLSAISMMTKKVTLGTAVSDSNRIHPAVLAQVVVTLDHISNGRAILGLGAGEAMNLDPYGIPWNHPISRLEEAIKILKALWTKESFNFNGRFFKLKNAFLMPKPVRKPHPPIWIAANSPRSMEITGEYADGWIPIGSILPPNLYAEKLKFIQNMAKKAGRDPECIEPAVFIHTVINKDFEIAKKMIELPAKLMLLYWTPEAFSELGFEVGREFHLLRTVFNKETVASMARKAESLPSDPITDRFVFGTPEDCISKIKEYLKAGARHFVLAFVTPPEIVKSNLRLYVEEVIPHLKELM
jgi:phthiodiolone/phenolphthiodiolone dimycocerosates ketoreductase